jgi:CubicO group peptidase (beta-lactamase class C family)
MRFRISLAILLFFFPCLLQADLSTQVDKLFSEWDKPDSPGCAVGVIRDGKLIYERGFGMANLEHGIKNTPTTVFDIGSTGKQFTAMTILLLQKEGKLSIDDDIRKWLPEMRDYGTPITIRHLIHHTSGIRDYLTLMALKALEFDNDYPNEEIVSLIAAQKELNFKPGAEHLYSNSGYFLLSEIVKRASGKTLREYSTVNIFEPLGMKNTHFHDDKTMIVKDRATGYSPKEKSGFYINMSMFDVVGDGSLMTTVEDLLLWDQNFYANKLGGGGQELIDQMLTAGVLSDGKKLDYAFALVHDTYRGLKVVAHSGSWVGYRAQILRFPEQKFTVICLANLSAINPSGLAEEIANIYLADSLKDTPAQAAEKKKPITAKESDLKAVEGVYRSKTNGSIWKLEANESSLDVNTMGPYEWNFKLLSSGTNEYYSDDGYLTMKFAEDHKSFTSFVREKPEDYERVTLISPTPDQLKVYAGEYFSEEIRATYTFAVQDGKLKLSVDHHRGWGELKPTLADEFWVEGLRINFQRQGDKIRGFTVAAGRVKNIKFAAQ